MASKRFDKTKPEDFNLTIVEGADYCLDINGDKWQEASLWDNGWGNEYGFVRQPEPNFNKLWDLLIESKITENKLGSAELINTKYPEQLKSKLGEFFKTEPKITRRLRKRLDLLELGINRSETLGKHYTEIKEDFESWSFVKAEYERLKK